jgi:hypothetical protein
MGMAPGTGDGVSQYIHPSNPELARLVENLPQWAREYFEERAGILEYEANFPRPQAEELAWREVESLMDRHSHKSK